MQSESTSSFNSPEAWVLNTKIFLNGQRRNEEILRHKWIQSEKARQDIGFDAARYSWLFSSLDGFNP